VIAPVDAEPAVASDPVQPPEAVQAVALVEDQLRVVLSPLATLVEAALSDTVGAAADTVTVADCEAVPPVPVQATMNRVVALNAGVLDEPLIGSEPLQPPEAVHDVALVEVQVNVEVAPLFTVLGLAASVTAGAAVFTETVTLWEALPPLPLQVSP